MKSPPYFLCLALFSAASLTPAHAAEPRLHMPFESADRVIRDAGGQSVGMHFPSSVKDQDDPASLDPDRFRTEARYGKGIRYFAADRSFSRIENPPAFDEPIEAVAISADLKVEPGPQNRFAALVTNRVDSDPAGFSLFLWGNQLRFSFGDGETVHDLRVSAPQLTDGEWHSVQAAFERGRAALWVDGNRLTLRSFDAATIAPPRRDLYLGGYPADNQGRTRYAFDGWLDEVALGELQAPLVRYLREATAARRNFAPPPPIQTTLLPVEGSEGFFGGQRVFHSFRGHPVPMTFLFSSSDPERIEAGDARLVFYLPASVELAAAHQSNHNEAGGPVALEVDEVERDGEPWKRYATRGLDLTKGGARWKRGPFVSLAFDAPPSVDEAPFHYALEYDGKEHTPGQTTLRFLNPPPAVPDKERGRFHAFAYFILPAFAYPDRHLWEPTAELLSRVGLTGKGRFYSGSTGKFRVGFDNYLRDRGFTLYEIGLWRGPNHYAMALNPERVSEAYVSNKKGRVRGLRTGEPVLFDYEPWRLPYKTASFREEIRKAFAKQAGLDETPAAGEIRADYRRAWTDFWLEVGNDVYGAMGELVRTHHPDPDAPRVSYTYFFPYDDEDALYRRFWSIPKDPRRAEAADHVDVHLISLYHTNDRELVDQTRLSQAHLDRPIWGISAIARVNPVQNFANPVNSLPPQRIEQKFVLTAALGMERQGIWPGRGWIDAAYLAAIGEASRFIWEHEDFYFEGETAANDLTVTPANKNTGRDDWAYTAHRHEDGRLLLTLFNFTDRELSFQADDPDTGQPVTIPVEPHGYTARIFEAAME